MVFEDDLAATARSELNISTLHAAYRGEQFRESALKGTKTSRWHCDGKERKTWAHRWGFTQSTRTVISERERELELENLILKDSSDRSERDRERELELET